MGPRASAPSRGALQLALGVFAALLAFAHAPLLRTGLFGPDYAEILGRGPGPVSVLRTVLGLAPPGAPALPWRAAVLALLLGAAAALRPFLARLLEPRVGAQSARAAAIVAALLVPLHPATTAAPAGIAALPGALALFLALTAAAAFLVARQEERDRALLASAAILALAGWCDPAALVVVAWMGLAEYASVRRHRPRAVRLRTGATTVLVFGALALVPRLVVGGADSLHVDGGWSAEGARGVLRSALSELGHVSTPVAGLGAPGVLLAGGLLLVALRPAFGAARSAPRLWAGMLAAWSAALLVALCAAGRGASMLPVQVAWCAGLALSITALARRSRAVLALAVALGWAFLAHAGSRPRMVASRALGAWVAEVAPLAAPPGSVIVLDPPRVPGAPALGADFGWCFHPAVRRGEAAEATSAFDARRVRALERGAFLMLVRDETFRREATGPLAVVARAPDGHLRRSSLTFGAAAPALPRTWMGALDHTPLEPIDPLAFEYGRLRAEPPAAPRELARLGWRTRTGARGALAGRVSEAGGQFVAEFDLSSSLEWTLAGSVRTLVVEQGVRPIERGEILVRLPAIPGASDPVVDGADWVFPAEVLRARAEGASLVLRLLATAGGELREIVLETDAGGNPRAPGAQGFVRRQGARDDPVLWSLDERIGEHSLRRTRGEPRRP
jgi:hypothetical protein